MKGDLHPVAFRLSQQLPSRVHRAMERASKPQAQRASRPVQKPGVGRGKNQGRAVIINGRRFETMKAACQVLKIGHETFYKLLDSGQARRVA